MKRDDVRRVLTRLGIEVEEQMGEHLWAMCPYHQGSRKPHWRIRFRGERAGLHHCFRCGEGGDLADLVMHVRGHGQKWHSKEWLSTQFEQVDLEDLVAPPPFLHVHRQGKLFVLPPGVVREPLEEWPGPIRDYALTDRGLTPFQIDHWGIGYAMQGRLAGRIVMPVHDRGGAIRSYMGRAYGPAKRKYLYPDEQEGADLDVFYGELTWHGRTCVVTEGAIKSLAVERAFPWCSHAALGGSSVRPMLIAKLTACFKHVVVLTDADPAGEKAGDELEAACGRHVATARVRLPEGKDPDSVPREELQAVLGPCLAR